MYNIKLVNKIAKVGIDVVPSDIKKVTRELCRMNGKEYMLVIVGISKRVQHAYFKDMATGEILAAKRVLDTYTMVQ